MNQPFEVSVMLSDFAHDARADVRGLDRRDHEHSLEILRHVPVHERHLKLVLEVADRAKAADVELGADLPCEIDQQTFELRHLYMLVAGGGGSYHLDSLS